MGPLSEGAKQQEAVEYSIPSCIRTSLLDRQKAQTEQRGRSQRSTLDWGSEDTSLHSPHVHRCYKCTNRHTTHPQTSPSPGKIFLRAGKVYLSIKKQLLFRQFCIYQIIGRLVLMVCSTSWDGNHYQGKEIHGDSSWCKSCTKYSWQVKMISAPVNPIAANSQT